MGGKRARYTAADNDYIRTDGACEARVLKKEARAAPGNTEGPTEDPTLAYDSV